uniref:MRG domain-containing protein n=1 Tax=Heterorhabditis bacteriophora TaxID=37862 RepID=A0A1I7W8J8_HETBA
MKKKVKKTEDDVRRELFKPISRASHAQLHSDIPATWCQAAESRLFKKILEHKPAVSKHFHLMALTDYMNNIYEDEDTDFEDVLSPEDLKRLKTRRSQRRSDKKLIFKPKYKIRPTPDQVFLSNRYPYLPFMCVILGAFQIIEKLNTLWDMSVIEHNEYMPEGFEVYSEFFLPDGQFSELIKKKEEGTGRKRTRRVGSPDSMTSRSSTPANRT